MSSKFASIMLACLISLAVAGTARSQSPEPETGQEERTERPQADQDQHRTRIKSFPDDVPGLQALAIQAYEEEDYLRFVQATMKLRKKRPYEQQYLIGMVIGGALLGRTNTAYNYMHIMQQQGLSYDFNSTDDTLSIRKTEVYDYLNGLLIEAGQPMGSGRVAFRLPPAAVQPESLAWDDSRGTFLVGSIENGALLAVEPGGETKELLQASDENGLLAITGIAVDPQRKRLWLSSAGVPGFAELVPTDLGRGAVFEFNLETLELLNRYDLPVDGLPHVPGKLVVSAAGDVYVLDRAVPMVFRKLADADKLEAYFAGKGMTGFRDMAFADKRNLLYVADAAMGILVVNPEDSSSTALAGPESLNLGGISGLSYGDGSLFMVQNGITPQRLMRLQLDAWGTGVSEVKPLAIALDDFDAPSFGTIQDGAVYYFASSNQSGLEREPAPVIILKTPMILSEDILPVEQRKWDKEQKVW